MGMVTFRVDDDVLARVNEVCGGDRSAWLRGLIERELAVGKGNGGVGVPVGGLCGELVLAVRGEYLTEVAARARFGGIVDVALDGGLVWVSDGFLEVNDE